MFALKFNSYFNLVADDTGVVDIRSFSDFNNLVCASGYNFRKQSSGVLITGLMFGSRDDILLIELFLNTAEGEIVSTAALKTALSFSKESTKETAGAAFRARFEESWTEEGFIVGFRFVGVPFVIDIA